MFVFIAILFILGISALIGWSVGRSVPDEAQMGGDYLRLASNILFVLVIAMTLYGFGYAFAALFAVTLIFVRDLFGYVTMPLTGAALALATLHDAHIQIIVFVLVLVLNFLLGVTVEKRAVLLKHGAWQPGVALVIFAALQFLR